MRSVGLVGLLESVLSLFGFVRDESFEEEAVGGQAGGADGGDGRAWSWDGDGLDVVFLGLADEFVSWVGD